MRILTVRTRFRSQESVQLRMQGFQTSAFTLALAAAVRLLGFIFIYCTSGVITGLGGARRAGALCDAAVRRDRGRRARLCRQWAAGARADSAGL